MPSLHRLLALVFPARTYSQRPAYHDPETERVIQALERGERSQVTPLHVTYEIRNDRKMQGRM